MRKMLLLSSLLFIFFIQPVYAQENPIQEEIFYDILIDRFNIGNQNLSEEVNHEDPFAYHGGDLLGVINRLDHLHSLGFTAIILSPIQQNAKDGYHGYWIEDFYELNPHFGTMEDLHRLISEAHKRDMKVVLELVTNYVAPSHPFVNDVNKEDWFKANQFKTSSGHPWREGVAVLDQDQPVVQEYLIDVAKYWLNEVDFDGFKLHDADLASVSFLDKLTTELKNIDQDFYLIAGRSEEKGEMDHLYDLPHLDAVENDEVFQKLNDILIKVGQPMEELYETFMEKANHTNVYYVDHKYSPRFSLRAAENGRGALTSWKLAYTFLYTTPGVPVILQGSEIPMYGPTYQESQQIVRFHDAHPELAETHERISALRREFTALTQGDFTYVGSDGAMSVIKRTSDQETMYVAINNDEESRKVVINDIPSGYELRGFLGDHLVRENKAGEYVISIPRESAEVFILQEETGINWLFISFIIGVLTIFVGTMIYLSMKQRKAEKEQQTN